MYIEYPVMPHWPSRGEAPSQDSDPAAERGREPLPSLRESWEFRSELTLLVFLT